MILSKYSGTSNYAPLLGSCPGCRAEMARITYSFGDSLIYCCNSCDLEFLRPLPLTQINQRQMDSVEDAEMFSPLLRMLHERLIVCPEIRKVSKILGRNDFTMLDIGGGTGWISKIWAESGARVTGLEPSHARGAIARDRGIRVLSCYVEEVDVSEMFDLIVIRHVLEHLEHPAEILQKLHSRLNFDGLLLIIVPNIDCIGRRLFDTDWTWVLPWHCNFFNPKSLRNLLQLAGFVPANMYLTPSPLWYPESFVRKFPSFTKLLGTNLLSMLPFTPLVVAAMLAGCSDNITAIARAI
jgi:2-polyprenyl-3-methyl-5-hydroxy-6-metoxy-1,4-benzoquinol methylase